jgi:hypothetical protein
MNSILSPQNPCLCCDQSRAVVGLKKRGFESIKIYSDRSKCSMIYRYSYNRMSCYALRCVCRNEGEIETLEVLLRVKERKDESNAVFIKRQKNNPGISQ